jgi:hypothetical protein
VGRENGLKPVNESLALSDSISKDGQFEAVLHVLEHLKPGRFASFVPMPKVSIRGRKILSDVIREAWLLT